MSFRMEDMFNVINVHHVAVYPQTILNISMIREDLYDTFHAIRLSGGCISKQKNQNVSMNHEDVCHISPNREIVL